MKAHNRQLAGAFMGSLWHKPDEVRNIKSILNTKFGVPHLAVSESAPFLYHKTFKCMSGQEPAEKGILAM